MNTVLYDKSRLLQHFLSTTDKALVRSRGNPSVPTPPVAGADLRVALVASCLRGAFPLVDLRAICFVRAMVTITTRAFRWFCGCYCDDERERVSVIGATGHGKLTKMSMEFGTHSQECNWM